VPTGEEAVARIAVADSGYTGAPDAGDQHGSRHDSPERGRGLTSAKPAPETLSDPLPKLAWFAGNGVIRSTCKGRLRRYGRPMKKAAVIGLTDIQKLVATYGNGPTAQCLGFDARRMVARRRYAARPAFAQPANRR
jgi:hypothetical protein